MNFKLTSKYQHAQIIKGKKKNILSYFLNGKLIHKIRVPYDENYEYGVQNRTHIFDVFLLNGSIYQKRKHQDKFKTRKVRYPVAKKNLEEFNIPKNLKITLDD